MTPRDAVSSLSFYTPTHNSTRPHHPTREAPTVWVIGHYVLLEG